MKELKCGYCGKKIEDTYFSILDNYLQAMYFDSDEENCFCCKKCLLDMLQVEEMEKEE